MGQKRNDFKAAQESLNDILRRISPYIPKTPKSEEKQPKTWKLVSNGTLPPINSIPAK